VSSDYFTLSDNYSAFIVKASKSLWIFAVRP